MKKNSKSILFLAIFMMLCGPLCAQKLTITKLEGNTQLFRNGVWSDLKLGDVVLEGDVIATDFTGSAKIRCGNHAVVLGALTSVELKEIVYNNLIFMVKNGVVRANAIASEDEEMTLNIESDSSICEITNADVLFVAGGAISVYEGKALVYSPKIAGEIIDYRHDEDYSDYSSDELEALIKEEKAKRKLMGSVIVRKQQYTVVGADGIPEKPMDSARRKVNIARSVLKSNAEKEYLITGVSKDYAGAYDERTSEQLQKGSVSIEIKLPE